MMNKQANPNPLPQQASMPTHPIISDDEPPIGQQDTLHRVASIVALLKALDFSAPLSPAAESGLYWVLNMLEDTLTQVSDSLQVSDSNDE